MRADRDATAPATLADTPGTEAIERRRDDEATCVRLLPAVSRTFALSIELLPDVLRAPVRAAYLLCRIVDTIEDDAALPAARREALFDAFDAQVTDDGADAVHFERLAAGVGDGADAALMRRAGAAFRSFRGFSPAIRDAIRPPVLAMSHGMREYAARADVAGRLALEDLEDLERYCYFVAGTVGELLTALFRQTVPPLPDSARQPMEDAAVPFGLGLQLVNIVKDVAADAERGVCFLPRSLLVDAGVPEGALLDPYYRSAARTVVEVVCERARDHLERAVDYTLAWPLPAGAPIRRFCAVPLALAFATLREVERGPDTLRPGRTPKVSRARVVLTASVAAAAVHDDAALRTLLDLQR